MRFPPRLALTILLLCHGAHAQLRLPALPVPPLPLQGVSKTVTQLDTQGAATGRRATVERLLRDHRKVIAADPDGNAVVRNEVLATNLSPGALQRATDLGFLVLREQHLGAVGLDLVVLQPPTRLSTANALRLLRENDPSGIYDYDHLYLGSGTAETPPAPVSLATDAALTRPRIGLIDSGVDEMHPAFAHSSVHAWGCQGAKLPDSHGTAVASVLVAHQPAQIYAADVYCKAATGGSLDAIVAALDWLIEQHVGVINVSLVGPGNQLLEHVVASATAHGCLLVAAVGNDGPASPPLYPAAYPGVIGVTAVDAHHRVLLEAVRGPQVMFAALGADLEVADIQHGTTSVRGTSFAAPTVAALAARHLNAPDREGAAQALAALIAGAVDLGPAGRDLTYGYGFLGWPE